MNLCTTFKTIAAITAIAFPASLVAAEVGIPAQAAVDVAFGVFVVALTALTLCNDYRTAKPLTVNSGLPAAGSNRSLLPLAA